MVSRGRTGPNIPPHQDRGLCDQRVTLAAVIPPNLVENGAQALPNRFGRQERLDFGSDGHEPILMSIYLRNYLKIATGRKVFEYRKRFTSNPTLWYVCVARPRWQIVARIYLGAPRFARIEELAEEYEAHHQTNAAGLVRYFQGYSHGYSVPIQTVEECDPIWASNLPSLPRVPSEHVPLELNAGLLAALEAHFYERRVGIRIDNTDLLTRSASRHG